MLRQALIAASKNDAVGGARAENRQVFKTPPMLHELGILLGIICEEIVEYRLWPVRHVSRRFQSLNSPFLSRISRKIVGSFAPSFNSILGRFKLACSRMVA